MRIVIGLYKTKNGAMAWVAAQCPWANSKGAKNFCGWITKSGSIPRAIEWDNEGKDTRTAELYMGNELVEKLKSGIEGETTFANYS